MNKILTVVVISLAVIGAFALFGALGMGAMHATMMGGMGNGAGWIIGILLLIGIICAAVFILGSRRK
ncbi:MAG: hypothetical protein ACREV9_12365 [Burkholderiales bacterium]